MLKIFSCDGIFEVEQKSWMIYEDVVTKSDFSIATISYFMQLMRIMIPNFYQNIVDISIAAP